MGMENDAQQGASSDPSSTSVALTATSMINASDIISPEVYQANLRRIDEMKDIVRRLEQNNDQAHKNFLMDQLAKRVQDGREAEEMLQRLRNSTQLPEPPKPSSEPPIIQPAEVVLPSTATVIELPDNHSISSAPLTSTQPYPGLSVHPTAHQPYYALPQTTTRPPTVQTQYRAPYGSTNTFAYHPAPNQAPQRGQPVQPVFRLNEHTHYTPQHNLRGAPGPPQRNEHLQQPINPTVGQRPSADYYGSQRVPRVSSSHLTTSTAPPPVAIPVTFQPVVTSEGKLRPNPQPLPLPHTHAPISYVPNVSASTSIPTHLQGCLPQPQLYSTESPTEVSSVTQTTVPPSHSQTEWRPQNAMLSSFPSVPQTSLAPLSQQNEQSHDARHHSSEHPQTTSSQLPSQPQQPPRKPQPPPQGQSANTRPQPPFSKDEFIRAFQEIVQKGPQQTASFIVQTVRRGVRSLWFEEAIRAVPPELWKKLLTELPKYLPASFLPRQTTSLQPSMPPSTSTSSSIPVSHIPPTAQPQRTIQLEERPTEVNIVEPQLVTPHSATAVDSVTAPHVQSHIKRTTSLVPTPSISTAPVSTSAVPATPERKTEQKQPTARTPQQADKSRLAYDILRSLGRQIPTPERYKPTKAVGGASHAGSTAGNHSAEISDPTIQLNGREEGVVRPAGKDVTEPSAETRKATNQATSHVGPQESVVEPIAAQQVGGNEASHVGFGEDDITELSQESAIPPIEEIEHIGDQRVSHASPAAKSDTEPPQESTMQSMVDVEQDNDQMPVESYATVISEEVTAQLTDEREIKQVSEVASCPGSTLVQERPSISAVQPALERRVSTPPSLAPPPYASEVEPDPPEVQVASIIDGPMVIDLTLDETDFERGVANAPPQNPSTAFLRSPPGPTQPAGPRHSTPTPQFESLSLTESHVKPPTQTEDIRMATPTPPPPEVERISRQDDDAHHVTDLATQTNLIASSPMEERPTDRLPLFLPSPPSSPPPESVAQPPPDTDDDDIVLLDNVGNPPASRKRSVEREDIDVDEDSSVTRTRKRRKRQVYVLIPSPPRYVKRYLAPYKQWEEERKAEADVDTVSESMDEDTHSELQYSQPEPFRHLEAEQVVINGCNAQLTERACKWRQCDAILNCGETLLSHLKRHAQEDSEEPFYCRWEGCRKKFRTDQERLLHLKRHAIFPLPCPFAGCSETFNEPLQVMRHEVEDHPDPLPRQRRSLPYVPSIPPKLGLPPRQLPSHRVIPRRVRRAKISAERHAVVGPWVLWNIFGPVELSAKKQNVSMRGRPMNDKDDKCDARADEYDFLLPLSAGSKRVVPLKELDSPLVTQLVARGLLLWSPPASTNSVPSVNVERDAPMRAPASASVPPVKENSTPRPAEPPSVAMVETGGAEETGVTAVSGEEETVEKMLIMS